MSATCREVCQMLGGGVQNKSDTVPVLMGLPGSGEGAEQEMNCCKAEEERWGERFTHSHASTALVSLTW